ncbi:hypothetical protein E2C01_035307 [Portunus trituberculatus]|uniref:Uncharacterized protein n=1 Tax=Portunus trituberculatus TaxID=210409 RepID=A0A5B7F8V3_PORTR|nr:hypothetical protein [Portunus trituberculatus]
MALFLCARYRGFRSFVSTDNNNAVGVAVDRNVVVRDLDKTIYSLFSYLSSNSPSPRGGLPAGGVPEGDTGSSPFRPVAAVEATPRSDLTTPQGSFQTISGDTPPPLPERGPPSEAVFKGTSTASPSPSPSHWVAGRPGSAKDRKSAISSKASSDIELVNLCKSECVRDAGIRGSLRDRTSSHNGRDSASDGVPGGQCPSIKRPRRGNKLGSTRQRVSGQSQQDDKADTNGRVASTLHSQTQQGPAARVLDHHYSEIDIYEAANNTGSTTRSASATLSTNSAETSPPPVPPHLTGSGAESPYLVQQQAHAG